MLSENDSITVMVGRCNDFTQTKRIGGDAIPEPQVTAPECVPGGSINWGDITVTNESGIVYTWDIEADGNGYTFSEGDASASEITVEVGNVPSGFIVLKSEATPESDTYCAGSVRFDTISFNRSFDNISISGPSCIGRGKSGTFTLDNVPANFDVNWTLPNGYTITSADPQASTVEITASETASSASISAVVAGEGCGNSPAFFWVTIGPGPISLTSGPDGCIDQNTSYTYGVNVSGAYNYQWSFPDGFTPQNATWNNVSVNTGNSTGGQITVFGTSEASCPTSDTLVIDVSVAPAPFTIEQDKECLNKGMTDTVTFSVPCDVDTYSWTVPAGWTIDGSADDCSITVVTDGNDGTVSATLSNACGSENATLNVTPTGAGNAIIVKRDAIGAPGDELVASAISGANYQWYQDGTILLGQTSRFLDLTGMEDSISHDYCVVVTLNGCATQACESSTFNPARMATVNSTTGDAALTLSPNPVGSIVTINAATQLTGTGYTVVSPSGTVVFEGTFGQQNTINVNNWTIGTYTVHYTAFDTKVTEKFIVARD
jgi:hypothetical protein